MVKIKIKIFFKNRNNIVHFAYLLIDFFTFINKFKYIYLSPDFSKVELNYENDLLYNSFHYYLNEWDSCLCYHALCGPF